MVKAFLNFGEYEDLEGSYPEPLESMDRMPMEELNR